MTIRKIISQIQKEVLEIDDLIAPRAAEIVAQLSSLLGNCNDEIRKRDIEYNHVLLKCLEGDKKANRAKIKAEISPEYEAAREAKDTKELVVEIIRGLKYFLRAKEEEFKLGRHQ